MKLHLYTEQLGVKTHQLSILVMEAALNTDQKDLSPKKIGLKWFSLNLFSKSQKDEQTHPEFPNFNDRTVVSHAVL